MLNLWLLLLIVGVALMVLLWVGGLYLQGYFYTEPAQQLVWGAPAAGALLTAFLAWWCYVVASSSEARPGDIPYNTIFSFNPDVEMVKKEVRELWAVKENDEKVLYKFHPSAQYGEKQYKDTTSVQRPWNGNKVKAIEIQHEGETYRFDKVKVTAGEFPEFVNEKGWRMKVHESGPTGIPRIFRTGRFLANLFFNFMHLALWFVGLWLLMRFQWSHALLIGFCVWLVMTLALLPMMLEHAARVAQQRPAGATQTLLSILQSSV